jgi:hypothetical protein
MQNSNYCTMEQPDLALSKVELIGQNKDFQQDAEAETQLQPIRQYSS